MDRIKDCLDLFLHGRLRIGGSGRSFVMLPIWLAAVIVLCKFGFAVLCVILCIALGLRAEFLR